MTEQELKEIEARASAATPGPWVHDTVQSESAVICGHAPGVVCEWRKGAAAFDDCDFIAHAREDVPALIAEVRRLQELTKGAEQMSYDIEDYVRVRDRMNAYRQDNDRLRALIKQAEYHTTDPHDCAACPWCDVVAIHKDDCPAFTPDGDVR